MQPKLWIWSWKQFRDGDWSKLMVLGECRMRSGWSDLTCILLSFGPLSRSEEPDPPVISHYFDWRTEFVDVCCFDHVRFPSLLLKSQLLLILFGPFVNFFLFLFLFFLLVELCLILHFASWNCKKFRWFPLKSPRHPTRRPWINWTTWQRATQPSCRPSETKKSMAFQWDSHRCSWDFSSNGDSKRKGWPTTCDRAELRQGADQISLDHERMQRSCGSAAICPWKKGNHLFLICFCVFGFFFLDSVLRRRGRKAGKEGRKQGWKEPRLEGSKAGRNQGWKEPRLEGGKDGRNQGWKEGRKEGTKAGRNQGWKEGRKEGRRKEGRNGRGIKRND